MISIYKKLLKRPLKTSPVELPLVELPDATQTYTIPRVIYQTWETKDLPAAMSAAVSRLVESHPYYRHELFDASDRRSFIEKNFPVEILYAYDALIPGAYKADLWRYCILYLYGGVYIDIKFEPVGSFTLDEHMTGDQYLLDHSVSQPTKGTSVANGFIITHANNPVIKRCIQDIYNNVRSKYYGDNPLAPTGPHLLGKYVSKSMCQFTNGFDKIYRNETLCFKMYDSYRSELVDNKIKHYSTYWKERNIYHNIAISGYHLIRVENLPPVNINEIPRKVFQTWKTADIPSSMRACVTSNKDKFPDFEFSMYCNAMCEKFIEKHYAYSVKAAFNALLPGAYKADLWRYCVLYIFGGVYMDIKYRFEDDCDLNAMIKTEHFVKDRQQHFSNKNGVYNGFIIVKPRNIYMLQAIAQIVSNVNTHFYGENALYPTGPGLLSEILPTTYNYTLRYDDDNVNGAIVNVIRMKNKTVLRSYDIYRSEQRVTTPTSYDVYWKNRTIYILPPGSITAV